jgi:hypothetical protein
VESYQFKGYQLRRSSLVDLPLAKEWTKADLDHAGKVDPGFWLGQSARAQSFLLSDSDGPVFFFKGIVAGKSLEVHVQFPPEGDPAMRNMRRRRISQGLIDGLEWLEGRMRGAVEEVIFESTTPALIRFSERHLGFRQSGGRLRKRIDAGLPLHQLSRAGD